MDETARHLRLLTKTIAAVNSTLDLEEVLSLVAREVADALGADACFVYLYDEQADELVLRATSDRTSSRSSVELTAAIVLVSRRRCLAVSSTCRF